jgi:hypothetical protein
MAVLMGVAPSSKTIVPVGDTPPLGGVTVAVSVTDCPPVALAGDAVKATVGTAVEATFTNAVFEVLVLKSMSPE